MHIGYSQSEKRKVAYGSVSDSLEQSARIFISLHIESIPKKGQRYGTIIYIEEANDKITDN